MPAVEQKHCSGGEGCGHDAGIACQGVAVKTVGGEHDQRGEHGAQGCRASAHEGEDHRAHDYQRQGGGQSRAELAHVTPRQRQQCHAQMVERRASRQVATRCEGQYQVSVFKYRYGHKRFAWLVHAEEVVLPEKRQQHCHGYDNNCDEGNVFPECFHNISQFSFLVVRYAPLLMLVRA